MQNIDESMLKVAVGTSIKQNARDAGKEVAEITLKRLEGKPNFFLLFCTLDYEDTGGFENLLGGVWSVLPEGTLLAGGTVTSFLNSDGCYAKGVTSLAISYPNMNIISGYGKNTKRNPKKAGKQAAKMLKNNFSNEFDTKILLSFISGTKNPEIPGVKDTSFTSSKIMARISLLLMAFFQKVLLKGVGREQEVLEVITKELPDFNLIHGSITCGAPYLRNFQFYNKKIFKDAAVVLGIECDIPLHLDFSTGAKKTDNKLIITKTTRNRNMVKQFNNKPAFPEFLRSMGWTKESIGDFKWTDRGVRYPIAYEKNGKILLRTPLLIFGDYMGSVCKIEQNDVFIANMTSQDILDSTDEVLAPNEPLFGFFSSCLSQRDLLGIKVFQVQEKLKHYFKDKPFLLLYLGGEAVYKPRGDIYYHNESICSAIFYKHK